MGGGAWPFLVGGVICQVNSGNERDHCCTLCVQDSLGATSGKRVAITGL